MGHVHSFERAYGGLAIAALLTTALSSLVLTSPTRAVAIVVSNPHTADGIFTNPNEWNTARATVSKQIFTKGTDGSGGAALYVEQFSNTLNLMYDYFNPQPGFGPNTGFDVFFQVPSDNEDYLVQIRGSSPSNFKVFTKPVSDPSAV